MTLRREIFGYGLKQLSSRMDVCLWPGDQCQGSAIRAHSVQNQNVLDLLTENGHVVMPHMNITLHRPPKAEFRLVGRNKATTFTGLCSTHDNELFSEIEKRAIDIANPKHLFLLAYRAVLREAHASRKAAVDIQATYLHGADKGLYPRDTPCAPGMLAVENMMSAYMVHLVKEELDQAWQTANWTRVGHKVARISVSPCLAVNSMFSTGIYSKAADGPAFVMLNVFPIGRSATASVLSYLDENNSEATATYGELSASDDLQQLGLSKLIVRKCENFVLSPPFYDSWTARKKEAVLDYFERTTLGGQEHESATEAFSLFSVE